MTAVYVRWVMAMMVLGMVTVETIESLYTKGKLTREEADALIVLLQG